MNIFKDSSAPASSEVGSRQGLRLGALFGMLALGLAILAPMSAVAEVEAGDWEVGFDIGETDFDQDVADGSDIRVGGRMGFFFTDHFELEGQVAVSSTDDAGVDLDLTTGMVNAVFNFNPGGSFVPYIFVGAGVATLDVGFAGPGFTVADISDESFAYQGGVGGRIFFGGDFALRLELSQLVEETFGESSEHTSGTVGVSWTF